ncbi:LysR family transcriptional regulator [Pelagibacterium montanilacus]|uniref:LysR family transcriptional regulator n=1 Tax=Pelagibacterium montanilacus TaxID=2185280 RepID=UPI000F8DAA26|nr:LysR family transcriptional regulator [Pelagibacterium montanilacus]
MSHFDPVTARLVLALARDGSIAKAAERENIAPSAISRRLSDLEARLGVVMFDRSPTGVSLTPSGAVYADRCRRIFREVADLETEMAVFAAGKGGRLRISASSSALSGRLPELLARYVRDHPDISLDLREMVARAALSALDDAQTDIAIVADNYDFARYDVSVFEDDHVWVIASPDHPLAGAIARRMPMRFEDVIGHEVVGFHHSGALDRLLHDAAHRAGRTLGERVNVESIPSLVRMVEAGFGIGFLRNSSVHLLAGTDVVHAPLEEEWARRKLLLAKRRGVRLPAPVEHFVDLACSTYSANPSAGGGPTGTAR